MTVSQRSREATELVIETRLREDKALHSGRMVRFDTFSRQMLLMRAIPRPGVEDPIDAVYPREWTDNDTTHLMQWFQANRYKKVSAARIERAVLSEAYRNQFNAAKNHLDMLPGWDGVPRMRKFLIDVCNVIQIEEGMTDAEVIAYRNWLEEVSASLFLSIVARVMSPGCKVDTMVVLEGPQGGMKSRLLRKLALRDEWFSDSMPIDLANKDAKQHLTGKLIIEMAEVGQLKSTRLENLKAFLSAQDDKFRPSYGRHEVNHPRQCVFVGSTNESGYLSDASGNRRFLPVRCGEINIDLATELIPKVYAEALREWRENDKVQWWLPQSVIVMAEREQRSRLSEDSWEIPVKEYIRVQSQSADDTNMGWISITISKALTDGIPLKPADQGPNDHQRMGKVLAKLGGIKYRKRQGDLLEWRHKFRVEQVEQW